MYLNNKNMGTLKFIVSRIKILCLKRSFSDGAVMCSFMLYDLEKFNSKSEAKQVNELINSIHNLIDDIKFLIQTEIRYVLFPLQDIKKEAYEIGKSYMKNFFEWAEKENSYTPEQLMKILNDDEYKLKEMKEILMKIEKESHAESL